MATTIKKISELEKLSALSSSSNVLIEENGKAKRIAANNIGGKVKTVNGVEPDANGNIAIEVGSNGVTSWNDLTDKPFYEEDNRTIIEWNGSTEGRDSFSFDTGFVFYKVSDLMPTVEELTGGEVTVTFNETTTEGVLDENNLIAGDGYILVDGLGFVVTKAPFVYNDVTVEAPSTGVYLRTAGDDYFFSLTYGTVTVHQIDKKFIPGSGGAFVIRLSYADSVRIDDEAMWEYSGIISDRTQEEIIAARDAGSQIVVKVFEEGYEDLCCEYLTLKRSDDSGTSMRFSVNDGFFSTEVRLELSEYDDDCRWYVYGYDLASELLPLATTENEGAFLRVVDGSYALVNLTDVSTEGA